MSTEAIMADLHEVANASESVELLNLYKGVPVVSKASFVRFDPQAVTLKTTRPQLVCLERDGRTVVLSDILQVALSAQVAALDAGAQTVTLAQLSITDKNVGDRMTVRVEPLEVIPVNLWAGDQLLAARLTDLSLNGAGLMISGSFPGLKRKMPVRLAFQLPNGPVDSEGIIRYSKQDTASIRVGVDFSENTRIRVMVADYIAARRDEIMSELGAA